VVPSHAGQAGRRRIHGGIDCLVFVFINSYPGYVLAVTSFSATGIGFFFQGSAIWVSTYDTILCAAVCHWLIPFIYCISFVYISSNRTLACTYSRPAANIEVFTFDTV
jgi:hypothetical protein